MKEMVFEALCDLVDGTYDDVLFDNDTKKLEITWDGVSFSVALYYKDMEIDEDEWDDDWIEQETWESDFYFNDYLDLYLGECNVVDSMADDIVDYIN